jgi:hypothetical protein
MPFPSKAEAHGKSKACAFGFAKLLAQTDFPDFFALQFTADQITNGEIYKIFMVG